MLIRDMVSADDLKQLIATAMEYAREEGLLPASPNPQVEGEAARGLAEEIGHIETARSLIPMVVAQHVREELRQLHRRRARPEVERLFHPLLIGIAGAARDALLEALGTLSSQQLRLVYEALRRKHDALQQATRRRGLPRGF